MPRDTRFETRGKRLKATYHVTGVNRKGNRTVIVTEHTRRGALDAARRAKEVGFRNVRIEIAKPERTQEASRRLDRREAEERARRKGRLK